MIVVDTNLLVFAYDATAPRHASARRWLEAVLSTDETMRIFFSLLESAGTGGNLATDALIAAHAIEMAATVHSDDRDFGRFPTLRWQNPLD